MYLDLGATAEEAQQEADETCAGLEDEDGGRADGACFDSCDGIGLFCREELYCCVEQPCEDEEAANYGMPGECEYYEMGCTDPAAENHDPDADMDDGSCTYQTCNDPSAANHGMPGDCEYYTMGCTDPAAENHNPVADMDDGSCTYDICDDPWAATYGMAGDCEYYDWGSY